MKSLYISRFEIQTQPDNAPHGFSFSVFIKKRLAEAGFDLSKPITREVDIRTLSYLYKQEEG